MLKVSEIIPACNEAVKTINRMCDGKPAYGSFTVNFQNDKYTLTEYKLTGKSVESKNNDAQR